MRFKNIRIALRNIKKRKSAAASLAVLVMLASLFLCVGVNIMGDAGSLYEKNKSQMMGADNAYVMNKNVYRSEYLDFFQQDSRVEKVETLPAIPMDLAILDYAGGEIQIGGVFLNMDEATGFQKPHIVKQAENVSIADGIVVPIIIQDYGYQLGDTICITYKNMKYPFTIVGFHRTSGFGITNMGTFQYYLTQDAYESLRNEVGEGVIMSVLCKESQISKELDTDFREYMREKAVNVSGIQMYSAYNAVEAESAYNFMGQLLACVFMCFSFLIVLIAIFIIRFRILNNMEENMTEIGTLGAIGYTGREIQLIYAYEYIITSVIGTVTGILLSIAVFPIVGSIIGNMVGLAWYSKSHMLADAGCAAGMIVLVVALCCLFAGRIRKYPPIVALSKGMKSHSAKKNRFPLEHGKGNLQVILAGKEIFHFLRQNITILLCIMGVTFAVMSGLCMYIIMGHDLTTIKQISGWEWPNVQLRVSEHADMEEMKDYISKIEGVRKINYATDLLQIFAEDSTAYLTAYEDFDTLETINAFEGRVPMYDNEALVTKSWAERNGKKIGDRIKIEYGGYAAEYIISGFNQSFSNNGNMIELTGEGFAKISPYERLNLLSVYLEDNVDADKVIETISQRYGTSQANLAQTTEPESELTEEEQIVRTANEKIARLLKNYGVDSVDYTVLIDGKMISGSSRDFAIETMINFNRTFGSQLKSFKDAFAGLTLLILFSSIVIITLMLTIIIRALLSKRRIQFGVMKAMGFTTKQLMQQIALSIMPATILGSVFGVLAGIMFGGKLIAVAMQGFGISQVKISVSPWVAIIVASFILLYTFFTAMLYASKVRKISVYELLVD